MQKRRPFNTRNGDCGGGMLSSMAADLLLSPHSCHSSSTSTSSPQRLRDRVGGGLAERNHSFHLGSVSRNAYSTNGEVQSMSSVHSSGNSAGRSLFTRTAPRRNQSLGHKVERRASWLGSTSTSVSSSTSSSESSSLNLSSSHGTSSSPTLKPERRKTIRKALRGTKEIFLSGRQHTRSSSYDDDLEKAFSSLSASLVATATTTVTVASPPSPSSSTTSIAMGSAHNHQSHQHLSYFNDSNRGRYNRQFTPMKNQIIRVHGCSLLWGVLVFLIGGWIATVVTTTRNVQLINNMDAVNAKNIHTVNDATHTKDKLFDSRYERRGVDGHKDLRPLQQRTTRQHPHPHQEQHQQDLPLSEFPTLQYPFANSELVGLFFGSSDRSACKKVAQKLSEYFDGDGILLQSLDDSYSSTHQKSSSSSSSFPLSIIYVSSDRDISSMQTFARSGWFTVPWNGSERSDLKRHFRVGATNELNHLGLTAESRRSDIPALIILDNKSRSLLTANGVEDLHEFGDKALVHWMDLYDLVRAMEEKYAVSHPPIWRTG